MKELNFMVTALYAIRKRWTDPELLKKLKKWLGRNEFDR